MLLGSNILQTVRQTQTFIPKHGCSWCSQDCFAGERFSIHDFIDAECWVGERRPELPLTSIWKVQNVCYIKACNITKSKTRTNFQHFLPKDCCVDILLQEPKVATARAVPLLTLIWKVKKRMLKRVTLQRAREGQIFNTSYPKTVALTLSCWRPLQVKKLRLI